MQQQPTDVVNRWSVSQNTSPVGIGLALFIAQLVGGPFTGASLNPARSFGAAVAAHHFPGYHWIYWLGPFLGSLLAVGSYKVVRILEVETAQIVHGDSRGVNDFNNAEADTTPVQVHVLDPVAKSDLEKGLKAPGEGSSATGPIEHAQR
jgi:aquaporin related protein